MILNNEPYGGRLVKITLGTLTAASLSLDISAYSNMTLIQVYLTDANGFSLMNTSYDANLRIYYNSSHLYINAKDSTYNGCTITGIFLKDK